MGGEQYFVIGNFNDDANTQYQCNNAAAFNPHAYYYIDDVSVTLGACTTCPPLTVTAVQVIDANCYGAATGGFVVTTTGGTGPYDYTLMLGGNPVDSAANITGNHSFIGLMAGTYIVNVLDDNGCPGSLQVIVGQPAPIVPVITGDTLFCTGDYTTLDAGSGYDSYNWSNGATTQTTNVYATGYYAVTVNLAGCTAATIVHVTAADAFDATITSAGPYCVYDTAVTLTAIDPGGIWSGAGITNAAAGTFNPSAVGLGSHLVIYTISSSCGDTDSAMILVSSELDATINPVPNVCSDASSFTLTAASPGGSWSGAGITNAATGLFNPSVADTGLHIITYTISGACGDEDTVTIRVINCEETPVIYVPNIFSPNDDGINDMLYVRGQGIRELEFFVYDRWGEKVFETTDKEQGWDGTFRNKALNEGVFVWSLKATMENDKEIKDKGTVTLVR